MGNIMYPERVLVDIVTGEVCGYIYSGGEYKVAVTEWKAKELRWECCDCLGGIDLDTIEVVLYGNSYALVNRSVNYISSYSDSDFERLGDLICIYGYVFNRRDFVSLNNETAINRCLGECDLEEDGTFGTEVLL